MKKIPLHSLILWKGPVDTAYPYFNLTEIMKLEPLFFELGLNVESIKHDFSHEIEQEFLRRLEWRLQNGKRVVVVDEWNNYHFRQSIVRKGTNVGVSLFYVATSPHGDKEFNMGDRVGEVINLQQQDIKPVHPYSLSDLGEQIRKEGYSGITAIGDIHGQKEALKNAIQWGLCRNHFIIFLGDIVDYGPKSLECLEEAYDLIMRGRALSVIGNHERKIMRWFEQSKKGDVRLKLSRGNRVTIDAYNALDRQAKKKWECKFMSFLAHSTHHLLIDNVLFVHGAAHPDMWGTTASRLKDHLESHALYGQVSQTTPKKENGYPNRIYDWVSDIQNARLVVVGHDIRATQKPYVMTADTGGQAVFLDTGSGKGGILSSADLKFDNGKWTVTNFNQH